MLNKKMMYLVRKVKYLIRKAIARLNIHLIVSKYGRLQLSMYNESSRAEIPKYINLGAGSFYHPLWHNVDMPNKFYKVLQNNPYIEHDFSSRDSLPLKDDSVEIVYCSHVIEHLSSEDVRHLFLEVKRVLKAEGVFRLTFPDSDLAYQAYMMKDDYFWGPASPWKTNPKNQSEKFLEHVATLLSPTFSNVSQNVISEQQLVQMANALNRENFLDELVALLPEDANSILPEGHCNWFNYSKAESLLRDCGFGRINRSAYLQSNEAKLREPTMFDGTTPEWSVYVECQI
jgi:predicted SAM-dependent methyltransferase